MSNLSWELESALDTFEQAVDRKVCAQIDAGCCQTRRDREKAHEAEDQACEAREALEKAIKNSLSRSRVKV